MGDARKNLAYSLVATAPSPAASGTSLVVTTGQSTRFPAVPFNATICAENELPVPTNAEIVRVTNVTSDTLTITRAQEGTSARTIVVGDQIWAGPTDLTFAQIEDAISVVSQGLSVETASRVSADAALSVKGDALSQAVSVVSQSLSVETAARVAADTSINNAVSVVSHALSIAFVSIAVVSNAVSVEAATRAAADTSINNAISIVSQALSAGDAGLSVRIDTQSQAISVISQQISALSQAVSVADAALSVRIDTQSQSISALSNAHSATSARLASVMSLLDGGTTGQVLKKVDATDFNFIWDTDLAGGSSSATVTSANISALSNRISVLSAALSTQMSAISQAHSALSQAVSVADAALSVRINTVSQQVSVISQQVSALSQAVSVLSQAVSVADAALSVRINTQSQSISVLSQQVSVLSQAVSAADAALSVRIDTQSQSISALSNAHSATSARLASVMSLLDGGTTGQVLKKVDATDFNFIWDTDLAGGSSSATVTSTHISALSQNISVISQALSVETAARVSADNALSNLISALSADVSVRLSAISQAHSALSQAVSVADAALSVRINTVSQGVSVVSNALSVETAARVAADNALSTLISALSADVSVRLSAISQAHSALSQAVSVADAALSVRIDTQSQAISAISQQVSALSQAVSVLSNAVSVADAALSVRINTQSQSISALSNAHSATSARLASVMSLLDGGLSGQVLKKASDADFDIVWSVAGGSSSATVTSANISALSNSISVISQQVSVLSQALSALTSAHNALSNVVSALSVGPGASDQYLNLQNVDSVVVSAGAPVYLHTSAGTFKLADASAISVPRHPIGLVAEGSIAISASGNIRTRDSISLASAQWGDIISGATAGLTPGKGYYLHTTRGRMTSTMPTGAAAAILMGWGVTPNQMRLAEFDNTADWLSDAISVGTATAADLSNKISAVSALVSTTASALSARIDTVSQQVSVLSAAHDVLSNAVSVLSAGIGGVQIKLVGNTQSVSGSALIKISGLSASVAAGGTYLLEGFMLHAGTSTVGFGLSMQTGTLLNAALYWNGNLSVGAGAQALQSTWRAAGYFNETGFGSITYSAPVGAAGNVHTRLDGVLVMSTTGGTVQIKAKAGATNNVISFKQGSYLRAFKIG